MVASCGRVRVEAVGRRVPKTPRVLYRCRSCDVVNDFQGIEEHINKHECPGAILNEFVCCGCGFCLTLPPMWFVVEAGAGAPAYIETGYETIPYPERKDAA